MITQQLAGSATSTIAQRFGLSEQTANTAVQLAVPLILTAMARNASQPDGAASLHQAINNDHDGSILTQAPDILWGTDASMVQTAQDGRVWVFAALDHFNSEVIGHYVSTNGSRFSALEPISQALSDRFGGVSANIARGITLRADNGPQYIARHFTRQLAHWGMALSHALPHQPETNGVCERFFRTLKEQAIFGRTFRTIAEIRSAVDQFVVTYNAHWRLARLGFRSPLEYRLHHSAGVNLPMAA